MDIFNNLNNLKTLSHLKSNPPKKYGRIDGITAKKSTRPVKLKIYFKRFIKPEEFPRSYLAGADQTLKRYSILKIITEKISNA